MEPEEVSFQLLREMTDAFSSKRKLGEGSMAVVYRGVTHAGEDVAVKLFKDNYNNTGSKQFKNEIYHLGMLRHQNIVQVLGYCYEIEKKPMVFNGETVLTEEPHRAICLEYLHNGSLQDHLSDEFGGLDWETRFKIIKGICEGLKLFHHDLEEPLYHLDLKPDNILLDKDMAPKIVDFGLSMIFDKKLKATITQYLLGTSGYRPPEYIDTGEVSDKFDIFSLGVMMIKIVSGPKGYPKCLDISLDEFINQVQKNWRHRLQATCDGFSLEMHCHQVVTCIQIALNCVENDSQRRPNIVMIAEMLNEIETGNYMLPYNGCQNISRATRNNNKSRKESKDITAQHHNIELMPGLNCSKLELVDAEEISSYVVKELIVGRDEEKMKIVTSLLEVISKTMVILPIYGIGGIGKTTLARLIYNDPKFKSYLQVWVNVTQGFDLTKIRDSIVSQLSKKESCDNERQVLHGLNNLLSNKKILVVLDDLWEHNQFQLDELKEMLYNKDSNIIVLVTTRSEDVANRICTNLQPHKILPLTNDMCWDIIKHRADFDSRDDSEQLISIGLEIAQMCDGVALAAQSLGFTLRSMNIHQWMKAKDYIWNSANDHVLAPLQSSYSYMAPCLKTCFTYCATFPKSHKMVKDDLIYQWISLDFIEPTKLHSSMHLCEKYIVQLLELSFFQHSSLSPKSYGVDHYLVPPCFTVPDLVHDLASSISDAGRSSCRYALLADCSKALELSCTSAATLVALRFWDCRRIELHSRAFDSAKSLRVLDLSECLIQKLPDSIGDLKQLRYLNAPGIQDQIIPRSITGLSKLIYLNFHGSHLVSELPESIGEMNSLMYLDLSGCSGIERLPESLGKLKRLLHLNLANCTIISALPESIGEMDCLMHLDLSDCPLIERLPRSLGKLKRLVHLNLANCCSVQGISELLSDLTELQFLNLSRCTKIHRSDDVQLLQRGLHETLGNLTNLRYLNLSGCFIGLSEHKILRLVDCMETLYYSLKHLDLSDNTSLTSLPECIGNLKSIHTLDLSDCIKLSKLPTSLGEMYNLKFLILENCLSLRFSDVSRFSPNKSVLPKFLVKTRDGVSSNLVLLCDVNDIDGLNISQLQNVTSTEEALKIKLMGKQKITKLSFDWTQDAKRCVKDSKVLEYLVPPNTLRKLNVGGYSSKILPYWFMGIGHYLYNLTSIKMMDMPKCISLPPFGQLSNLKKLVIRGMDRITHIDESFYGGPRAFPQLKKFELGRMRGLQVWKTMYSFKDAVEELMSDNLEHLTIDDCPMLRLIPCPPRASNWKIDKSDNVLSSLGEAIPLEMMKHLTIIKSLSLSHCEKTTLPHWLVELTSLQALEIRDCSKLNNMQIMRHLTSLQALTLRNCSAISELPDWLGSLGALKEFVIQNCRGIKYLPESIGSLTELEELKIIECPDLDKLCRLDKKMMKLISHIKTKKKKDHHTSEDQSTDSKIQNKASEPLYMTYTRLEKITNGFSKTQKVGQGAYGKVYRGLLDGEEIAVKVLRNDMPQLEADQFRNEFQNLKRLEHPNILRLVGYCYETRHVYINFNGTPVFAEHRYRALCLEYLQNGSLRSHLRDEFNGLDWQTRFKIIKGTCDGLKYLYEGIEKPVYHLDLKPANILLDKNMVPKLADFGLSRMFHGDDLTCITQSPVGTTGYLPPEYVDKKIISNKLDIYSLGVVMIETIAGPDGRSKHCDMSPKEFIDHVCGNWRRRLEKTCPGSVLEAYCKQVKRCIELALNCIETEKKKRPIIGDVIDKLNKVDDLLNI